MKQRRIRTRTSLALLALGASVAASLTLAGAAGATSLSGVTTAGDTPAAAACANAVMSTLPTTSWSGTLGCWTDGTGAEPLGYSYLTATAIGTGTINFRWRFRTIDTIPFDWLDIRLDGSCVPPTTLVGGICKYNPNPVLFSLFDSGWRTASIPVTTGGAHSFFIGVRQDAFGDEASVDFTGMRGNLQLKP